MPYLGAQLLRKLTLAIPEAIVHHRALQAFTEGLRLQHGDVVDVWEEQVLAWEENQTNFCPYDLPEESACPRDDLEWPPLIAIAINRSHAGHRQEAISR
jgi:hypothetical protein